MMQRRRPMKLRFVQVLALSLAFANSGCPSTLRAQEASVAPDTETDRCVRWMKATVSGETTSILNPADFCSGVKKGNVGGWYSIRKCGDPTAQLTNTAPRYCSSSGQITGDEAWAAGFSSSSIDGRELLDEVPNTTRDPQHTAVVFYSRTAVWMEGLRVPAGMYELMPSKSPEGWNLAVARQEEAPSGTRHPLGSVSLKGTASNDRTGKYLVISTKPWSERCPGPSPDTHIRELHFMYGSTDLFVCIRPDQARLSQQAYTMQSHPPTR